MAPPHIKVLGVYSPGTNASDFQTFVDDVFSRNADEYEDLSPEALASERKAIEQSLADAVLLEALVENPDEKFSMGEFVQPDPGSPSNNWQVAWCEKFLTSDGGGLLGEYHFDEVPSDPRFRVVFYIHYWKHENGLDGPYGSLELPPVRPMPQRLWQLAPYEPID
jgi:hypothetical protein